MLESSFNYHPRQDTTESIEYNSYRRIYSGSQNDLENQIAVDLATVCEI